MEKVKIGSKEYLIDIDKCREQGLLQESVDRPCSWEEYCEKVMTAGTFLWDEDGRGNLSQGGYATWWKSKTEEKAKAFAAFGKLLQLRDAWVGNWKPDYKGSYVQYGIVFNEEKIDTGFYTTVSHPLTFPTMKMRDEFLETFKELLETAKELL